MDKVGFTGTRRGITRRQLKRVIQILHKLKVKELHHGDCVGADAQLAQALLVWGVRLHAHVPIEGRYRAFTKAHVTYPPKSYKQRDFDIVNATGLLVATPKRYVEELHSGTWMTIRYARKTNKPRVIVWPDGTYTVER